jgi:hypothetical protein
MDWQAGSVIAGAAAAAGGAWELGWADATRLFQQAQQQAEQQQQQRQYSAPSWGQSSAATLQQQYSQPSDRSGQYSSAADATIAALAAAGSLGPPPAANNSAGNRDGAMFRAKTNPLKNGIAFGMKSEAQAAAHVSAASTAGAAAHCDVWSSLDTRQQKQQHQQQELQRQLLFSYGGVTANASGAFTAPNRRMPMPDSPSSGPAALGILHGYPNRQAANLQGAACFATANNNSSSSSAIRAIPGVPIFGDVEPPAVLPGVPITASAADNTLHNTNTYDTNSLSAAALQQKLLARMSAAAAAVEAQQQQGQFTANAPERMAYTQQLQLQSSTPAMAHAAAQGTHQGLQGNSSLAASTTINTAAAAAAANITAATADMWQPAAASATIAELDATPFATAYAPANLVAEPAAVINTAEGDGSSGAGCVRGGGDSFGGFCDALLGSCKGLAELLQTWSAEEGGEEAMDSMALLPDDVDGL